jgi:flagellar hook assembly protein FlgD
VEQNYPNPFNPATVIGYRIPEARDVTLQVVDILGRRVATLVSGRQEAGYHTARFDGTGMGSGVYFYRLEAGNDTAIRRMLLVR